MFVRIIKTVNGNRIEKSIECEGYEISRCERNGAKYLTIELKPRGEIFALDQVAGNEVYIMNNQGQNIRSEILSTWRNEGRGK